MAAETSPAQNSDSWSEKDKGEFIVESRPQSLLSSEDIAIAYGTTDPDADVHFTSKTWIILASTSLLALSVTLCISAPASIVVYVVRDIGGTTGAQNAAWIVNAANLLQAVFGPPASFLTDMYGRRSVLVILGCLGIVGTAVSATASDLNTVIIGQAFTGAALALKPLIYAIASEVLPRNRRILVQYWINVLAGVGGVIGVLAPAALVNDNNPDGWRNLFWIELAFIAAGVVGIVLFYRPPPRPTKQRNFSFIQKIHSLDLIGWGLMSAGITLLIAGLTFGGNRFPWGSAQTLAPLCTGAATLVAFTLWEWRGRSDGICHHSLFKERNFPLALFAMFMEGAILFSILSQYSNLVGKLFDPAPISQGLRIAPFWIATLITCFPLAAFSHYFKEVKMGLAFGYILFLVSAIMLATGSSTSSTQYVIADAIAGAGFAAPLTLLIVVAQLCTPPLLISTASALMSTSRAIGAAIGVAIYSAIFTSKVATHVGPNVAAALIGGGLAPPKVPAGVAGVIASIAAGNPAVALKAPGMTPDLVTAALAAAREGYNTSYHYVWYTVIAFSAVALASVLVLSPIKAHLSNQVDSPAEKVTERAGHRLEV